MYEPENNTIAKITESAIKHNVIEKKEGATLFSYEVTLLEELCKNFKKHILFVFDDFEVLRQEDNKLALQELKNILSSMTSKQGFKIFSMFILYTDTLKLLISKNDDIIKDGVGIEVLLATNGELKKMLWERILKYKLDRRDFESTPNYLIELQPFTEAAVDMCARNVSGNPLAFINILKEGVALANERKYSNVTEEIITVILDRKTVIPSDLSITEKQILEYIKGKGQVTIDEIKAFQGKTKVAAFYTLNSLYKKDILIKDRKGKLMLYSIKRKDLI